MNSEQCNNFASSDAGVRMSVRNPCRCMRPTKTLCRRSRKGLKFEAIVPKWFAGAVLNAGERRKRDTYPELAQRGARTPCVHIQGHWNACMISLAQRLVRLRACRVYAAAPTRNGDSSILSSLGGPMPGCKVAARLGRLLTCGGLMRFVAGPIPMGIREELLQNQLKSGISVMCPVAGQPAERRGHCAE